MSQRIIGDKVDLDYRNIQEFFDKRGENKKLGNKYNYVLYQDDCPELAIKRDLQEKKKYLEYFIWMLGRECWTLDVALEDGESIFWKKECIMSG